MTNSSKSTLLLNCLVALSTKNPNFPYPLWENGFQIENIEPGILLLDGSQAKPDIQFKRNDDQITFFECKDGHCDKAQLARYKKITSDDIKRSHITCLTAPNLKIDLAYFGTVEKEEKLLTSINADNNTFPIIILDKKKIAWNPKSSPFNYALLNTIFKEINFDVPVPQSFIPFTVDDDDESITTVLLQHFMAKTGQTFTLDELVKELFPQVITHYTSDSKAALKARIGRLVSNLRKKAGFEEFIQLSGEKYTINSRGVVKFRNACERLSKDYKEQRELRNNSLNKWFAEE